jgi:3-deoxy-D-manno-octulosonic-acid transferase
VEEEVMIARVSVTEDMALSAALRTSCEHPGFTMLFTCMSSKSQDIRRQKLAFK